MQDEDKTDTSNEHARAAVGTGDPTLREGSGPGAESKTLVPPSGEVAGAQTALAASCRFYGKNGMFGRLVSQGGNECGLITQSYSPCKMEIRCQRPDENTCPVVQATAKMPAEYHTTLGDADRAEMMILDGWAISGWLVLTRTDRVELLGGIVHLPAEFREVARLANLAGLNGLEVVDVEVGIDVELAKVGEFPRSFVTIRYRGIP